MNYLLLLSYNKYVLEFPQITDAGKDACAHLLSFPGRYLLNLAVTVCIAPITSLRIRRQCSCLCRMLFFGGQFLNLIILFILGPREYAIKNRNCHHNFVVFSVSSISSLRSNNSAMNQTKIHGLRTEEINKLTGKLIILCG